MRSLLLFAPENVPSLVAEDRSNKWLWALGRSRELQWITENWEKQLCFFRKSWCPFVSNHFPSNFLWFYSSYTWGYPTLLCFLPSFLSPVPIPGMYREVQTGDRGEHWHPKQLIGSDLSGGREVTHLVRKRGRYLRDKPTLIFGYCMVVTPGRLLISAFVVVFGY